MYGGGGKKKGLEAELYLIELIWSSVMTIDMHREVGTLVIYHTFFLQYEKTCKELTIEGCYTQQTGL